MSETFAPSPDLKSPDLPGEAMNSGPYTKEGDNVVRWHENCEKQALLLPDNERLVSGPYGVNGEEREHFIAQNNPETGEIQAHMHFMDYVKTNEEAGVGIEAGQIEDAAGAKAISGSTLVRLTTDKNSGARILQTYDINTKDQAVLELPPDTDLRLIENYESGVLDQVVITNGPDGEERALLNEYISAWRQEEIKGLKEAYGADAGSGPETQVEAGGADSITGVVDGVGLGGAVEANQVERRQRYLDEIAGYLESNGIDLGKATTRFEEQVADFVWEIHHHARAEGRGLTDEETKQIKNIVELVEQQRQLPSDLSEG